jgi:8-amino-7-oxononanoate synthase
MRWLDQSPGRTVIIDGQEHLFLSGYSYLGMSFVPEFLQLVNEGLEKYGVLFPSSRISNTRLKLYDEMEAFLSRLTQQEESVLYSSGYLAGRAVINVIAGAKNIYMAPGSHPAIQTPATILGNDWQDELVQLTHKHEEVVLLTDSVHPLRSSITAFDFLKDASSSCKINCIIDDSHGIGLLAINGEGISAYLPRLTNVEYVLTYSLSKAFHINGGAVSCNENFAVRLRGAPAYTASTAMSPFLCYAFLQGQQLYAEQRKKLKQNVEHFRTTCAIDIVGDPALPIFILNDKFNQQYFDHYNMIISSFSYPDPQGEVINRIVLNALHTKEDIAALCGVIQAPG